MLAQLTPLFASLNHRKVDYVVIGGIAVVAYGVPRLTLDVDLLIRATPENAESLLQALVEAGLGTALLTNAADLLAHEVTIFKDRIRVDVQTRTPGLSFPEAFERRRTVYVAGIPVNLVSLADLIASKEAAGRPKDVSDVLALKAIKAEES